jgi:hypothetical protein
MAQCSVGLDSPSSVSLAVGVEDLVQPGWWNEDASIELLKFLGDCGRGLCISMGRNIGARGRSNNA